MDGLVGCATIEGMNEDLLRQHLEMADRQIAEGNKRIAKQKAIIAELKRDGHDIRKAEGLLQTLLDSQALHETHRRTILEQLLANS